MAAKKKSNSLRRSKNRRSGIVRFSTYVFKVLKQVHPELAITSKAMKIMDDFMKDIFNRLTEEAAGLVKVCRKSTLTSQDFQTATRLILPGELAHHAVNEATKAVANFMGSRAADRGKTVPRINREILSDSHLTTIEQMEVQGIENQANTEKAEVDNRVINIHLEQRESSSRSERVHCNVQVELSDCSGMNGLANRGREEYESATEGSEEESPNRKRKVMIEQNNDIKKKKLDESCLDHLPTPHLNIEIIDTQCSALGKMDTLIISDQATEESTSIGIQEPKSPEGSIEVAQNETLSPKKLPIEAPVPELIETNHVHKNDNECEHTLLISQDAMDSGVHDSGEYSQISATLQSTPKLCEKLEYKNTELESSQFRREANRSIESEDSAVVEESPLNVNLKPNEISSNESSLDKSSMHESVTLTSTDDTPIIYTKISTTVITTHWSDEK